MDKNISDLTLITNIHFAGDAIPDNGWIAFSGDTIMAVGYGGDSRPEAATVVDGKGALALPGVIDAHVHFREPGLTRKADIASESRAAVCGGVTSYLDMPNTVPQTVTPEAWRQKMDLAAEKSLANYGFFIGATNDNLDVLLGADYTRVPGVKLFMGASTGGMLVESDSALRTLFSRVDAIIAVHAEDQRIISEQAARAKAVAAGNPVPVEMHSSIRSAEACYQSSLKAVTLAREYGTRLHLCHISTGRELSLLQPGLSPLGKRITAEVSPHHLLWTADDYARKGTRIKMNPAVKTVADRDALRRAVADGIIDIVATDHAPHCLQDKEGDALTAASGAPMVQFSLAAMLDMFDEATMQRVMCANPAMVYGICRRGFLRPGYFADITLVGTVEPYLVDDSMVVSRCGWTPMHGEVLRHRVTRTYVGGALAYDVDASDRFASVPCGRPLCFRGKS